jgi:hypothetical protein
VQVLGAIILAGGALFGIWLGAYYAAGRLGAQLEEQARWLYRQRDDESDRLARQLDAEAERLERQLEHDREMRDLEELRTVLDDAASATARSIQAILIARQETPVLGYEVSSDFVESQEAQRQRLRAVEEAHSETWALALQAQRLNLRFGPDHPVPKSFWKARDELVDLITAVDVEPELRTQEQHARIEELLKTAGEMNKAFVRVCRKYTAVAGPPAAT